MKADFRICMYTQLVNETQFLICEQIILLRQIFQINQLTQFTKPWMNHSQTVLVLTLFLNLVRPLFKISPFEFNKKSLTEQTVTEFSFFAQLNHSQKACSVHRAVHGEDNIPRWDLVFVWACLFWPLKAKFIQNWNLSPLTILTCHIEMQNISRAAWCQ